MAAPSVAHSQTFAYSSGGAENHLSSNEYFSQIVVTNATSVAVNVCTDGGTAVAGAGTNMESVAAGATATFGNLQPLPQPDVPGTSETAAWSWTTQQAQLGTAMTYCSVIPQSSTSGEVTVSFQ